MTTPTWGAHRSDLSWAVGANFRVGDLLPSVTLAFLKMVVRQLEAGDRRFFPGSHARASFNSLIL